MINTILLRPFSTIIKDSSIIITRSLRYKSTKPFNNLSTAITTTTKTSDKKKLDWKPIKRVSRDTMDKIRTLNKLKPDQYNAVTLATEFKISTEAVRRILKSNFRPDANVATRQEKNRYAAMGLRKLEFKNPNKKP